MSHKKISAQRLGPDMSATSTRVSVDAFYLGFVVQKLLDNPDRPVAYKAVKQLRKRSKQRNQRNHVILQCWSEWMVLLTSRDSIVLRYHRLSEIAFFGNILNFFVFHVASKEYREFYCFVLDCSTKENAYNTARLFATNCEQLRINPVPIDAQPEANRMSFTSEAINNEIDEEEAEGVYSFAADLVEMQEKRRSAVHTTVLDNTLTESNIDDEIPTQTESLSPGFPSFLKKTSKRQFPTQSSDTSLPSSPASSLPQSLNNSVNISVNANGSSSLLSSSMTEPQLHQPLPNHSDQQQLQFEATTLTYIQPQLEVIHEPSDEEDNNDNDQHKQQQQEEIQALEDQEQQDQQNVEEKEQQQSQQQMSNNNNNNNRGPTLIRDQPIKFTSLIAEESDTELPELIHSDDDDDDDDDHHGVPLASSVENDKKLKELETLMASATTSGFLGEMESSRDSGGSSSQANDNDNSDQQPSVTNKHVSAVKKYDISPSDSEDETPNNTSNNNNNNTRSKAKPDNERKFDSSDDDDEPIVLKNKDDTKSKHSKYDFEPSDDSEDETPRTAPSKPMYRRNSSPQKTSSPLKHSSAQLTKHSSGSHLSRPMIAITKYDIAPSDSEEDEDKDATEYV